jgi:transcriptional regulator with XRE-family HTH domain
MEVPRGTTTAVNTHTLAGRFKQARLQAALRHGRTISQERMAEMVAEIIDRPLAQAQWSSYELGKAEPPLDVIRAAAKLSGLDEAYVAFGPKPEHPPEQVRDVAHDSDRPITAAKKPSRVLASSSRRPDPSPPTTSRTRPRSRPRA